MLDFFKSKQTLVIDYDAKEDQYNRFTPMSEETAIEVIHEVEKYVFGNARCTAVAKKLGVSNAYRVHSLYTKAIKTLVRKGVIKKMVCPDCSKDLEPEYTSDGDVKS